MRVDIVTKEYPPEIYGGAGVHVAELVSALRETLDVPHVHTIGYCVAGTTLAATLAAASFSPAAALPAAIFSIWHNLSGAVLAMYYRRSADRHQVDPA